MFSEKLQLTVMSASLHRPVSSFGCCDGCWFSFFIEFDGQMYTQGIIGKFVFNSRTVINRCYYKVRRYIVLITKFSSKLKLDLKISCTETRAKNMPT